MRRSIRVMMWVLGVLTAVVACGLVILTNPVMGRGGQTEAPAVNPAALREHVEALVETSGPRHWQNREALAEAAGYIRGYWQDLGLEVQAQRFEVEAESYENLIVRIDPLSGPASSTIVIGAHYDVCGEQDGADDNASGVAAILELARMLVTRKPLLERRIELAAYTLEEPPFFRTESMGSRVHARSLAEAGANVEAMIALDLIGYYSNEPGSQSYPVAAMGLVYPSRGDFVAVVADLGSWRLTRRVKALLAGGAEIPVRSINAPSAIAGVDFSDHQSFWRHGYPAVLVTDTAFYRNPNYHQTTDTIDTLDLGSMAEVVRGLYNVVVGL